MEWELDGQGQYENLRMDDGSVYGWVKVRCDKHTTLRLSEVHNAIGTGDYYGYATSGYVRAETLDECKALVLVLARMGG